MTYHSDREPDKPVGQKACELRATGMKWRVIAEKLKVKTKNPATNASGQAYNYAINHGISWPIEYPGRAL